jgi:hypothetical protein
MLVLGGVALQLAIYFMIDRRVHAISFVVSTGIYRGAQVAPWHRRGLLELAWLGAAAGQGFFLIMAGLCSLFYSRNASVPEVRLLSGLMAFFSLSGTLGWAVAMAFFWHGRLSSVVRQAEAD